MYSSQIILSFFLVSSVFVALKGPHWRIFSWLGLINRHWAMQSVRANVEVKRAHTDGSTNLMAQTFFLASNYDSIQSENNMIDILSLFFHIVFICHGFQQQCSFLMHEFVVFITTWMSGIVWCPGFLCNHFQSLKCIMLSVLKSVIKIWYLVSFSIKRVLHFCHLSL